MSRETVFSGRVFRVDSGVVQLDDGLEAARDVIVHPGAVGIVPVIGDDVVLVRQYRIAVERHVLEIPAGKLEPGDIPEHRAQIELQEEIGYAADTLLAAGSILPSVGILSERVHLFLAFDLRRSPRESDGDERIEVVRMPLEETRQRLRAFEFEDAKTVAGLHALFAHVQTR